MDNEGSKFHKMKSPEGNYRKTKLSRMSDVELSGDDFDSDDDFSDPDFQPEDCMECGETTNTAISKCLNEMEHCDTSSALLNDINFSLNDSSIEQEAPVPTTSAAASFKPSKRPRSPLPEVETDGPTSIPSTGGFNRKDLTEIDIKSKEFHQIVWKKKPLQLHVNEVAFQGNSSLPQAIKNLETPLQCFKYFFTSEVVKLIVSETNRAAHQENINTLFSVSEADVHKFIGILLYMSLYRYPSMESYWSKNAFQPIRSTMSCRQFENIKRYLSFADEEQRIKRGVDGYDPLYRIRSISELFNQRFDSVPKTARLCVDEQMCATKMKHDLRQYMPNKPHKWGIKLFVLCNTFGYSYRFEIFIGAGDNTLLPGVPNLGPTAKLVVRLTQSVSEFQNHIVYFDNFYTSLPLLIYLRAKGIFSLGIIRSNRISNSKLPNERDEEFKKAVRGYAVEFVGTAYGVDISTVLWKDNRGVRLASTYVGAMPFLKNIHPIHPNKAPRSDRKRKQYVEVDCPQIIKEYNRHMGGVVLMDGLMGRYHIRLKTRNPMNRLFYHFIDMTVTNAYILYHRINPSSKIKLPDFREQIAHGLCTFSLTTIVK